VFAVLLIIKLNGARVLTAYRTHLFAPSSRGGMDSRMPGSDGRFLDFT
jgi:hypothetical protein